MFAFEYIPFDQWCGFMFICLCVCLGGILSFLGTVAKALAKGK